MLQRVPKVFKNFYVVTGICFCLWMLFFDSNNALVLQYSLTSKINSLETEKEYYEEKIQEVEKDREELLTNEVLLEKYAREKYFMKKESEDLFVIVEKE